MPVPEPMSSGLVTALVARTAAAAAEAAFVADVLPAPLLEDTNPFGHAPAILYDRSTTSNDSSASACANVYDSSSSSSIGSSAFAKRANGLQDAWMDAACFECESGRRPVNLLCGLSPCYVLVSEEGARRVEERGNSKRSTCLRERRQKGSMRCSVPEALRPYAAFGGTQNFLVAFFILLRVAELWVGQYITMLAAVSGRVLACA